MKRKDIFLSIVLIALYLMLTYAFYTGVASHLLGANDFYSRWMGARALFLDGKDPYSDAVTGDIQIGMYGRLAHADEDQVAFAYPLYAAFFAAPLVALPYAWAESFWIAFLILGIIGASIAFATWVEWRLTPLGLLGLIALTLTFYPALRGIFLGQFTLLVFASIALGLALIAWRRDELAGWVLAISTVKPHVAIVVLAVILVWALRHKRWRVWRGFVSAMMLLIVGAFLFLPNWLSEFVGALGAYQTYIQIGPPIQVLSEVFLRAPWSGFITVGFSILMFGALIHEWWRTIDADWKGFLRTVELAAIFTTAAMIRTATTDQTLLLLPWMHWLAHFYRSGNRAWAVLIGIGCIVVPWVVFLSTRQGNQEAPIATTTTVTLTLIGYVIFYGHERFRLRRVEKRKSFAIEPMD